MNYEIIRVEETQSGEVVTLNRSGDKFYVYYRGENGVEAVKDGIETREAAMALFMKFVWAFADGTYNSNDRAAWLA